MNKTTDPNNRNGNRREVFNTVVRIGLSAALIAGMLSAVLRPVMAATSNNKAGQVEVQGTLPDGTGAVVAWNKITQQSIQMATPNPVLMQVYLARVQAAVYNAVVAIQGGYQPYKSGLAPRPEASVDAAVAKATFDMLVQLFPGQTANLDAYYTAALADIPDGDAKAAGIEVGQKAAAEVIELRKGDGMGADIGFTMPAPAPGVWQLPAGANPVVPWMSKLKPYLLQSPQQFQPGPPPELSSTEWAEEYEEVRLFGGLISDYRTTEQTDIARFWTAPGPVQYNTAFQKIAQQRELEPVEAARLFVMGNLVATDAVIGCFDAKYHYLFWRPQFAIPQGDSDGNPATIGDPNWKPLLPTPGFPEYVSAHSCLTSATVEVLVAFLGTQKIDLELTSSAPNLVKTTRYYKYAQDLVSELVNARVWGGIHYRESDIKGAILGRKVANWALDRFFLPIP